MATGPTIIWVVEDDPSAQRIVVEKLKHHGFAPVSFDTAEKAYAALSFEPLPALIILDMLLPGMSGVDLIRLLKQNKEWEKIPVVVVTVLSRQDAPLRGAEEELRSTFWVNKPFETSQLIKTVESVLAAAR
jgi:DNA-binding response OmpR family regulator